MELGACGQASSDDCKDATVLYSLNLVPITTSNPGLILGCFFSMGFLGLYEFWAYLTPGFVISRSLLNFIYTEPQPSPVIKYHW